MIKHIETLEFWNEIKYRSVQEAPLRPNAVSEAKGYAIWKETGQKLYLRKYYFMSPIFPYSHQETIKTTSVNEIYLRMTESGEKYIVILIMLIYELI